MRYVDAKGNVLTYEQLLEREKPKLGEADELTLKWQWWRRLGYTEIQ